jgi:succinyl-CoA synthetase beta subunit
MKLFEFEAKNILKQYGIVIPQGKIASKPAEAKAIAQALGKPAVVKSQILVSGRGKAGGIVFVSNGAEARDAAAKLLGSNVKGCVVERLLVEERLDIVAQFYASLAIDRQTKTYIALASTSGGVDIEEVAQTSPEKIARYQINVTVGFSKKDATEMLSRFNLDKGDVSALAESLSILYTVAMDYDAELVELNPLVKTLSGRFVAADARIIVDDNAVFRHPELVARDSLAIEDSPREIEAKKQKLA